MHPSFQQAARFWSVRDDLSGRAGNFGGNARPGTPWSAEPYKQIAHAEERQEPGTDDIPETFQSLRCLMKES